MTLVLSNPVNSKGIVELFPEKLQPFLKDIENPLDETQILVKLFKDKDVRIIMNEETDEFGSKTMVAYFHRADIAKEIGYDYKNIRNWKRWNINMLSISDIINLSDLSVQIERPKTGIQDEKSVFSNFGKRTDKNAKFISEHCLKILLLKVNTEEGDVFQEWILRQSTIFKAIINKIVELKKDREMQQLLDKKDKINNELIEEKKLLENKIKETEISKEELKDIIAEKSQEAAIRYRPRNPINGFIYLASSPEYEQQFLYKIGYTTDLIQRGCNFRTANPDMDILHSKRCLDVVLAEELIHGYKETLRYKGEFFYISSQDAGAQIIDDVCEFVDNLNKNHNQDHVLLQKRFIDKYLDSICDKPNTDNDIPENTKKYTPMKKGKEPTGKKPKRPSKMHKCFDCDELCISKCERCRRCAAKYSNRNKHKVERPPIQDVVAMIEELNYCGAAKHYGVSDNCLRKWIRLNGIDPNTVSYAKSRYKCVGCGVQIPKNRSKRCIGCKDKLKLKKQSRM